MRDGDPYGLKIGPDEPPIRDLTVLAHWLAINRMIDFKNKLRADHLEGLYHTLNQFTLTSNGSAPGRFVVDLPTGAGKTLCVEAWLTAAHQLKRDVGVIVAASHIEALAKIIRTLKAAGVPDEKIGLIHNKKYCPKKAALFEQTGDHTLLGADHASLPATTGNEDRPFLFISHQRVRGASGSNEKQDVLTRFRDRERDLLIWDEVMMTTDASAFTSTHLDAALGAVRPFAREADVKSELSLAYRYVEMCSSLIGGEMSYQQQGGEAREVVLPTLSELEHERFRKALTRAAGGDGSMHADTLVNLLNSSGQTLRVAPMGDKKSALVQFRVSVPASLQNVVVLDASHAVNRLVALDPTVRRAPWFEQRAAEGVHLKSYEDVTFRFLEGRSGRGALTEAFSKKPTAELAALAEEIVQTIASIPEDEAVIVFTFKRRGKVNIEAELRRRLGKAGVNLDAMTADGRPRLVVLTWGRHTSLNEYAHAHHVVFAGVLQLPDELLLASAVGQRGDLLGSLDGLGTLTDIKRGDVAGVLYQALSRGRCRFTDDGKAWPMTAYLIHHDRKIRDEIDRLMPGVTWAEWDRKCMPVARQSKVDLIALQIAEVLRGHDGETISNRAIRARLGLGEEAASSFKRAVKLVEVEGWVKLKASFARADTAGALGFEVEDGYGA